ncbi:MAG: hypothetical protein ABJO09_02070 [Hyphomicrobiales bacterium]
MKLRSLIYFLIYVAVGPLIGLACLEIYGSIYSVAEFGIESAISSRSPKSGMWAFRMKMSYLVGGVPAAATGAYVALSLLKNGFSNFRLALRVSILSSMAVGLFLFVVLPSTEHLIESTFILAAISMIVTTILRPVERIFR